MTGPNDNPFDNPPEPLERPEPDPDADLDRWRELHPIWTGHAGQFQDAHGYVRDASSPNGRAEQ